MHFLKRFQSILLSQLPILLLYFVLIPSAQSEALVMPLEEVSIYIQAKTAPQKGCDKPSINDVNCPDSSFPIADQFLLAVAKGDKGNAARLLQQGASINYRSQNRVVINRVMVRADKTHPFLAGNKRYQYASGTAYDIALAQANADIVLWLLQRGANPAAGYFKTKIEHHYFAGNYPETYLNLPFLQRARIISVGHVLQMAVADNNAHKVAALLRIEPRAIHFYGNKLLPSILELGKWQLANIFFSQGKDIEKLRNFEALFNPVLQSEPTNYTMLQQLLQNSRKNKDFNYQALLSKAIHKKDAKALKMLVQAGADLNPKDQKAPLFIAADKNDVKTVAFLLRLGANPNIKYSGITLLHRAIGNEHVELAQALIKGGANVNAQDSRELTPIQIAIHKRNPLFTRLLLQAHANINVLDDDKDTLLHNAVRENKPEIAKLLIKSGAKINVKNNSDETPFQIAVRDNKLSMAKVLLAAGADVNVKDSRDRTPFQIAINRKDLSFAKLLIQARTNINVVDHMDNTPLMDAVSQVKLPLLKLLISSGADVNHANSYKDTALHIATRKVDLNMMRLLLQAGAKVSARNSNKETPLHEAVDKKHLTMVTTLMARKPKVNLANSEGRTALHLAVRTKNLPITRVLLQAGATANTVDINGDTPLFDALYWRKVQISMALIKKGARVNVANNRSQTPLDIALSRGLVGIATSMRNAGAKTSEELGSAGALRVKMVP